MRRAHAVTVLKGMQEALRKQGRVYESLIRLELLKWEAIGAAPTHAAAVERDLLARNKQRRQALGVAIKALSEKEGAR